MTTEVEQVTIVNISKTWRCSRGDAQINGSQQSGEDLKPRDSGVLTAEKLAVDREMQRKIGHCAILLLQEYAPEEGALLLTQNIV